MSVHESGEVRRTPLSALFDPAELAAEVAAGRVLRKREPWLRDRPSSIYDYRAKCLAEDHWTPVTTRTRGLVVDDTTGDVIASGFPKFFGYHRHGAGSPFAPPLPRDEPFEVYDKLDGHLVNVYYDVFGWRVTGRSWFKGEQVDSARALLYRGDTSALRPGTTYLAEMIGGEHRIVVDHGPRPDLVLLGAYGPDLVEVPFAECAADWRAMGGSVVPMRPAEQAPSLDELIRLARNNLDLDGNPVSGTEREGWVVRFASGLRVKVKLADHLRIAALVRRADDFGVWQVLAAGRDPALEFERLPEPHRSRVLGIVGAARRRHAWWVARAREVYAEVLAVAGPSPDRAEFARCAAAHPEFDRFKAMLFLQFDGRSTEAWAWREACPRSRLRRPPRPARGRRWYAAPR
ncbi:T4 RnlA family RNA ligase [Yinghuangia soli]|uniref:T4 RnlA family RNA ligase n=1 Tax=Yinghuangia soli TaxID=2908204 RepID=A0AA41Q6J4_9ACTN|nr:T4 RnlA family RNA ligase [Yinghuangia soli]MCF2532489.1 T4 RnlA family RNA ligase [Yinghuangia soli]